MVHDDQREIIRWADTRHWPWYFTYDAQPRDAVLKVHCGCVTATFRGGNLVHLHAEAEAVLFDALFKDLTEVFAYRALMASAAEVTLPNAVARRLEHGLPRA